MSDLDKTLQLMQARFNPAAAAGLDLIFQFRISDSGDYFVTVREGTCTLEAGCAPEADVTLTTDRETLKGLVGGEISGTQAFISGRLKTGGNPMLAMKLGSLFPSGNK